VNELDHSFEQLFSRVYQDGEDLDYTQKHVSNLIHGREQRVGSVLERAAKGNIGPIMLRVFEPNVGSAPVFEDPSFDVHSVEYFGDAKVYSVSSIDDQQEGKVEFIVTEGVFKHPPNSRVKEEPKEISYVSFLIDTHPVPSVDGNSQTE